MSLTAEAGRSVLTALRDAVGGHVLLWRGGDLTGRDIDLAVLPGGEARLADELTGLGYTARREPDGRVVWIRPGGPELDVTPAAAWPSRYPPLDHIAARAAAAEPLRVASAGDRLLVFAADAVAGRPLDKLARRAAAALAEPGGRESLASVAAAEREGALADLVSDPGRLAAAARRGRLPYGRALRLAPRSPSARAALRDRVRARLSRGRRDRGALLIAFSGMDGAGKSTAAEAAREVLQARGLPARVEWARLGNEGAVLDRLAAPAKRVLGGRRSVADPVAAGGPLPELERKAAEGRRGGPLAWAWTVVVALVNARSHRRAARFRRDGQSVVCDRWLTDSLVDLELRYGRHATAAALLRLLVPSPDLAILLAVDAQTSLERKPGDQAERVARRMEALYADTASRGGVVAIDARRPLAEVISEVHGLIAELAGKN